MDQIIIDLNIMVYEYIFDKYAMMYHWMNC